jgi:hypothetical protein
VGATQKYSNGWETAFGKGKKKQAAQPAAKTAKTSKKPAAKKKPTTKAGKKR